MGSCLSVQTAATTAITHPQHVRTVAVRRGSLVLHWSVSGQANGILLFTYYTRSGFDSYHFNPDLSHYSIGAEIIVSPTFAVGPFMGNDERE